MVANECAQAESQKSLADANKSYFLQLSSKTKPNCYNVATSSLFKISIKTMPVQVTSPGAKGVCAGSASLHVGCNIKDAVQLTSTEALAVSTYLCPGTTASSAQAGGFFTS